MKHWKALATFDGKLAWLFIRWTFAQCARFIERSQFFAWAPPIALSLLGTQIRGTSWEAPIQKIAAKILQTESAHWITEQGLWLHALIGSALLISCTLIFIFDRILKSLAQKSNDLDRNATQTQEELALHFSARASRECALELEKAIAAAQDEPRRRGHARRL